MKGNLMFLIQQQPQNVSFGYKSPLKPIIDLDAYTGKKLAKGMRTFEHILPHSKGGPNTIANCLITGAEINGKRGNMPFTQWLKTFPAAIKNIQNYLDKFRGLKVDGQDYVEVVKKTLNREAKGMVVFRGNNKKLNITG
jgi:hypothetical protein